MKKVVSSSIVALAAFTAVPAFAADLPAKAVVKAPVVAAPASPWDVLFGAALTSDYILRGVSQTNHQIAEQGYFEVDYTASNWLKLYAGVWGSSLATYNAEAEIDISAGVRLSYGNFGLDLGYVYYEYPDGTTGTNAYGSFGEFYAKPSYKFNDWLTVGAIFDGGDNFNNGFLIVGSKTAYYYSANAVVTLPWTPAGLTISVNPEIGRQEYRCTGCISYTYWDVGLDFNYKAITLDLRYWDTDAPFSLAPRQGYISPVAFGNRNLADSRFVATLKFDSSLSNMK